MSAKNTIDLWLDQTSDSENPAWVVSLAQDGDDLKTLCTFGYYDHADALEYAKEKCRNTGYPVVSVGSGGKRETIYEIDRPVVAICETCGGDPSLDCPDCRGYGADLIERDAE